MNRLLLREDILDFEVLTESISGNKNYIIKGIMMQAEKQNRNGRKYQKSEFEREIKNYNEKIIPTRRGVGELEHSTSSLPDMTRISHIFESPLFMQGNNVIGEARILDTAYGKTLKAIIDEKIPFGMSSKGTGEVMEIKNESVVHNFNLVTPADVVFTPSVSDAMATTVVESAIIDMIVQNDKKMQHIFETELLETVKKNIKNASKSDINNVIHEQFLKIINTL